jgi:hypothetical protein
MAHTVVIASHEILISSVCLPCTSRLPMQNDLQYKIYTQFYAQRCEPFYPEPWTENSDLLHHTVTLYVHATVYGTSITEKFATTMTFNFKLSSLLLLHPPLLLFVSHLRFIIPAPLT